MKAVLLIILMILILGMTIAVWYMVNYTNDVPVNDNSGNNDDTSWGDKNFDSYSNQASKENEQKIKCSTGKGFRPELCYQKLWDAFSRCSTRDVQQGWGRPDYTWERQKQWADDHKLIDVVKDMSDSLNCHQSRTSHN